MKYATEKKLKVMRREVYIMESAIISIKAIETLLAKEVYKEVLYAFEEHGKRRMCRVEKKNGRIYVHCDGVVLPIDEFKDKHLKRIMFQELKKK